jgi:hypothetical protein
MSFTYSPFRTLELPSEDNAPALKSHGNRLPLPSRKKRPHLWGRSFKEAERRECQARPYKAPFWPPARLIGNCREHCWKRVKVISLSAASFVPLRNALAPPKPDVTTPCDKPAAKYLYDHRLARFPNPRDASAQVNPGRANCRMMHIRCTPLLSWTVTTEG